MAELFIEKNDYQLAIRTERLDQLIDLDDTVLEFAESTAVSEVKDALSATYDIAAIFAKSGDTRDKQVVHWCINMSLYYLYRRTPDDMVPESVERDYEMTVQILDDIAKGKRQVDLPKLVDENNEKLSRRRWGSVPARSH